MEWVAREKREGEEKEANWDGEDKEARSKKKIDFWKQTVAMGKANEFITIQTNLDCNQSIRQVSEQSSKQLKSVWFQMANKNKFKGYFSAVYWKLSLMFQL